MASKLVTVSGRPVRVGGKLPSRADAAGPTPPTGTYGRLGALIDVPGQGLSIVGGGAGQSNLDWAMNGTATITDTQCVAGTGVGWVKGPVSPVLVDFIHRLRVATNTPVGFVFHTVGGTGGDYWMSNGTGGIELARRIGLAGGDLNAFIYGRGETGANYWPNVPGYPAELTAMMTFVRSIVARGAAMPFGLMLLGQGAQTGQGETRLQQANWIRANAANNVFVAGSLVDLAINSDLIHTADAARATMGPRYAEAFRRLRDNSPHDMRGPDPIGVTRQGGGVFRVAFQQHGGTRLIDGTGGSGASVRGFKARRLVMDSYYGTETVYPITSASITPDGQAVDLTIPSAPSSAFTICVNADGMPYGQNPVASEIVYDDQTIPGQLIPAGLPMFPAELPVA